MHSPRYLIFSSDGSTGDFISMLPRSIHACLTPNWSLAECSKSRHRFVKDSDTKMPEQASLYLREKTFQATSLLANHTSTRATLSLAVWGPLILNRKIFYNSREDIPAMPSVSLGHCAKSFKGQLLAFVSGRRKQVCSKYFLDSYLQAWLQFFQVDSPY